MTSLRATRSFCLHSTRAIGLGQHHLLRIAADDARHAAKATGTLTNHTCTMLLPTIQLGGIGALAAADNRRTTTPFSTNSSVPYGHRRDAAHAMRDGRPRRMQTPSPASRLQGSTTCGRCDLTALLSASGLSLPDELALPDSAELVMYRIGSGHYATKKDAFVTKC